MYFVKCTRRLCPASQAGTLANYEPGNDRQLLTGPCYHAAPLLIDILQPPRVRRRDRDDGSVERGGSAAVNRATSNYAQPYGGNDVPQVIAVTG